MTYMSSLAILLAMLAAGQVSAPPSIVIEWNPSQPSPLPASEMLPLATAAIESSLEADKTLRGLLYFRRATLHLWLREHAGAERDFKAAMDLVPQDIDVQLAYGRSQLRRLELEDAGKLASQMVDQSPDKPHGYFLRGMASAVSAEDDFRDLRAAIADLSLAIAKDRKYLPAVAMRAYYYTLASRFSEALDDAAAVRALPPSPEYDLGPAYIAEAMALWGSGQRTQAIPYLLRASEVGINGQEMRSLLWESYSDLQLSSSCRWIADLQKAQSPEYAIGKAQLAISVLQSGDDDEALSIAEEAAKLEKSNSVVWNAIGRVRLRRGEFAEAVEAFVKSERVSRGRPTFLTMRAPFDSAARRALIHASSPDEELRDGEVACEQCRVVSRWAGGSRHWTVDAVEACALAELGKFDAAIAALNTARKRAAAAGESADQTVALMRLFQAKQPYRMSTAHATREFDLPMLPYLVRNISSE